MNNRGFYLNQISMDKNELYKKNLNFANYLFSESDDSKSYYSKALKEIAAQITLSEISIHEILSDFEKIDCPKKGKTYDTENGSIKIVNMVLVRDMKYYLKYISKTNNSKIEKATIIINNDGSYEYSILYKAKSDKHDSINVSNYGIRISIGELYVSFDKFNKHLRKTRDNAERDKTSVDTNELLKSVYKYGKRTGQIEKMNLTH